MIVVGIVLALIICCIMLAVLRRKQIEGRISSIEEKHSKTRSELIEVISEHAKTKK